MRTHTYIYTSPREDIILSEKVSSFSCRRLIKVSNWKKKNKFTKNLIVKSQKDKEMKIRLKDFFSYSYYKGISLHICTI